MGDFEFFRNFRIFGIQGFWALYQPPQGRNLKQFSQIFDLGPFARSLSQNLTPGDVFSAWQQSLLRWLCSWHVNQGCQQNVICQKSSKALQRVLVVPAWQGALHENNRKKNPASRLEKLLKRFLGSSGGVRRNLRGRRPLRSCLGVEISISNPCEANF